MRDHKLKHIWRPIQWDADKVGELQQGRPMEQCIMCGIVKDVELGTRWLPHGPFNSMGSLVHRYCEAEKLETTS